MSNNFNHECLITLKILENIYLDKSIKIPRKYDFSQIDEKYSQSLTVKFVYSICKENMKTEGVYYKKYLTKSTL